MSSPEINKLIGCVLLGISIFALIVWAAATMGFCSDLRDKEARSSWEMHKKHSPLWWQRFTRWLLLGAFAFEVVGYFLSGPHPKQEPRPSLWHRLFSRDK